jgi:hypothetical protein
MEWPRFVANWVVPQGCYSSILSQWNTLLGVIHWDFFICSQPKITRKRREHYGKANPEPHPSTRKFGAYAVV